MCGLSMGTMYVIKVTYPSNMEKGDPGKGKGKIEGKGGTGIPHRVKSAVG